jgi:hypothetical protein
LSSENAPITIHGVYRNPCASNWHVVANIVNFANTLKGAQLVLGDFNAVLPQIRCRNMVAAVN